MKTKLLLLLLLVAALWTGCVTHPETYHHSRNHLIAELDHMFSVLSRENVIDIAQMAPQDAAGQLQNYRTELVDIATEFDLRYTDWIIVEPSAELQQHYDLSTQMLTKLVDGVSLLRQGVEAAQTEMPRSTPDYARARGLLDDGRFAVIEARTFRDQAEQELTDLGLRYSVIASE